MGPYLKNLLHKYVWLLLYLVRQILFSNICTSASHQLEGNSILQTGRSVQVPGEGLFRPGKALKEQLFSSYSQTL